MVNDRTFERKSYTFSEFRRVLGEIIEITSSMHHQRIMKLVIRIRLTLIIAIIMFQNNQLSTQGKSKGIKDKYADRIKLET